MSNTVSAKYNPALLTMPSLYLTLESYQSGAVEACWAQNPEVRGSKPRSAKKKCFYPPKFVLATREIGT